jgi:hypothetical protein
MIDVITMTITPETAAGQELATAERYGYAE